MPSRADRARRAAEWALRAASVALLAWMLWITMRPTATAGDVVRVRGDALPGAVRGLTLEPGAAVVHVELDTVPAPLWRDWLVALRRGGTRVTWSGREIPALAVQVEAVAEPRGGARVLIASSATIPVTLVDALGPLDSARVEQGGATITVPRIDREAVVAAGVHRARAAAPDSLALGRVLLIGAVSWEAQFVGIALEERGWTVESRLQVAPGIEVIRGERAGLDTARYAAVVALDSTADRDGRRLGAFVRGGGGLIVAGSAARAPSLVALLPARAGPPARATDLAFTSTAPRRALALRPLTSLTSDAVVLERGERGTAVAARRAGAGRVVQLGYEETWRWRLTGGEDAPETHRAWWSRVMASGAHRTERTGLGPPPSGLDSALGSRDAAPLAALYAALGTPSPTPGSSTSAPDCVLPTAGCQRSRLPVWLPMVLFSMLLIEWSSRRLRGAT